MMDESWNKKYLSQFAFLCQMESSISSTYRFQTSESNLCSDCESEYAANHYMMSQSEGGQADVTCGTLLILL